MTGRTVTCLGFRKTGLAWNRCTNAAKTDHLCAAHLHAAKRASVRNLANRGAR